MRSLACAALLLALFGCDDGASEPPLDMAPPTPDQGSPPQCPADEAIVGACPEGMVDEAPILVLDSITFAEVDPAANTVAGFDLDGLTSAAGDPASCGQRDFAAPDGREGIDNQLASLWPTIEAVTGDAVGGLIQGAINNGDLLIGLGIAADDEQITVGVQTMAGRPLIGTDARLLSHQTFTRDTVGDPVVVSGEMDGDWLVAGPFEIVLPLVILSFELDMRLSGAYLRLRIGEDGAAEGTLGGGISVDEFMSALGAADVPRGLVEFVRSTLQSRADLDRDPDEGRCLRFSAGLTFTAVPAWVAPW